MHYYLWQEEHWYIASCTWLILFCSLLWYEILPIFLRVTPLTHWQCYDYPSALTAILMNIGNKSHEYIISLLHNIPSWITAYMINPDKWKCISAMQFIMKWQKCMNGWEWCYSSHLCCKGEILMATKNTIVITLHWKSFCITGPLWGESPFTDQRTNNAGHGCFLCC